MAGKQIPVEVVLKASDNASGAFRNLGHTTDNFRNKLHQLQPTFQKMALAGTAAFATIGLGIRRVVSEAGEAEKIGQNFKNTFGESSEAVGGFIEDFGDKFAFVESEMMDGANAIGFQLNAMGDVGKEAGEEITTSLLTAAGGLSDFFGEQMDVVRASNAMAKALAGNKQSLVDMGFRVLDEDIEAMAETMGFGTGELTKLQEAQALTALIMDQTTGSVSGLEESMDTYTGRLRANRKALKETSQALGNAFLPMVTELLGAIQPIIENIGEWIEKNPELAKNTTLAALAIAGIIAFVGTLGLVLPSVITGFGLLATVVGLLFSPIGLIIVAIGALIGVGVLLFKNWDTLVAKGKEVGSFIVSLGKQIVDSASSTVSSVLSFFQNLWDQGVVKITGFTDDIVGLFTDLPGRMTDALSGLVDAITKPFKDALDKVGEIAGQIKEKAKQISPFHRESPSLVENVEKGVDDIKKAYAKLGNVNVPTIQQLTGESRTDRERQTRGGIPSRSERKQINLNFNFGTFVSTETSKRKMAEEIWREIGRVARAQGRDPLEYLDVIR